MPRCLVFWSFLMHNSAKQSVYSDFIRERWPMFWSLSRVNFSFRIPVFLRCTLSLWLSNGCKFEPPKVLEADLAVNVDFGLQLSVSFTQGDLRFPRRNHHPWGVKTTLYMFASKFIINFLGFATILPVDVFKSIENARLWAEMFFWLKFGYLLLYTKNDVSKKQTTSIGTCQN